jgi:hypothetical protein
MQRDPIRFDGDGPNLYAYVLNDPINRVDSNGEGFVDCGKAIARYLECKGKLNDRVEENVCSPNGPDAGHDKAIEQLQNRCEDLKRKAFNACKDPSAWGPLLIVGAVGVGVAFATGGGEAAAAGAFAAAL